MLATMPTSTFARESVSGHWTFACESRCEEHQAKNGTGDRISGTSYATFRDAVARARLLCAGILHMGLEKTRGCGSNPLVLLVGPVGLEPTTKGL